MSSIEFGREYSKEELDDFTPHNRSGKASLNNILSEDAEVIVDCEVVD